MRVFTNYHDVPAEGRGAVVALGNFDGVHRGHAALLAKARAFADDKGLQLAVLTFEPHPRRFFNPGDAPFRLTSPDEKARLLAAQGVDFLYVLPFDEAMHRMSAAAFQDRVLREGLDARAVAAGGNFRFGHRREGTLTSLAARDPALTILIPPTLTDAGGIEISSSRIRRALVEARPHDAAALLGRWWRIDYTVETGDRRGRELGYPTANGRLGELLQPAFGVYAVLAELDDGRVFQGAANIGIRPMWRSAEPLVETFLFDFAEDIYERRLRIALIDYLRPEETFNDLETLKAQMCKDCEEARTLLSAVNIREDLKSN